MGRIVAEIATEAGTLADPEEAGTAGRYRPPASYSGPTGSMGRIVANIAAIRVLDQLRFEQRAARDHERDALARWTSWGAAPELFEPSNEKTAVYRQQLNELLGRDRYRAAQRTIVNAHYTDPAYASLMWEALARLGFMGGKVLEPGAGAGTFIGLAPDTAVMTGVELDPTSAEIARALYPHATVRAESFADTDVPEATFDAAIGNVPFADVRLHDPRHNRGRHSIHNHFIIKALHLTRPGGIVALLTSRFTLDSKNPAARREIAELADLIGAVRLPSGAHRRAAGTTVVTDLVLFRRRAEQDAPADDGWVATDELSVDGTQQRMSRYFVANPDRILGTLASESGQFGAATLTVKPTAGSTTANQLAAALNRLTEEARDTGLRFSARASTTTDERAEPAGERWDGHLDARPDGTFTRVQQGLHTPFRVPRTHRVELRALLQLRDRAHGLLGEEVKTFEDTAEHTQRRSEALALYRGYVARYGPINRFRLRNTGRIDSETGEPKLARVVPTALRLLREDPGGAIVKALENFDEPSGRAEPATLLLQRTLTKREPVRGVETPDEALAVCMDATGRVDLPEIARLLGETPERARAALGTLVFDDPTDERQLIPAAVYLSGNVRRKLDTALAAAKTRPHLAVNVEALQAVIPPQIQAGDITAQLGAVWISPGIHQEFLREITGDSHLLVESPGAGYWAVKGGETGVDATSVWGTARMAAGEIARALLEQRPLQVKDALPGEPLRYVVNATETAAVVEKGVAIQERFNEWLWEDPERAIALVEKYNRMFNAIVLRDYSTEGEALTLPGLASSFTPYPHQRAAVARIRSEPSAGLWHVVGAGKTAEMVMGVIELKRLGLVAKPAIVVPNHMLEQFTRELLQLYPQARVLAASGQDLAAERRRAFVARAATNAWDVILLTRTAFHRLEVSRRATTEYVETQLENLRDTLARAAEGAGLNQKRLEKAVLRAEESLNALLDVEVDPGISFEATGIDYLTVDELHEYKNLRTISNINGAAIEGSRRATDLELKLWSLRSRCGPRVCCGATATPVANSLTETHVMLRLVCPDVLADAGVLEFDVWAATFGRQVTEIELAPAGGWRVNTRFAGITNAPELMIMWALGGDVKTAEDLRLPVPKLRQRADGKRLPETIEVDPTPGQQAYMQALLGRARRVRDRAVDPTEDNMLLISSDGKKAALDLRLVDPTAAARDRMRFVGRPPSLPPEADALQQLGKLAVVSVGSAPSEVRPPAEPIPTKLDIVAKTVASVFHEHRDNVYRDHDTGAVSDVPGALQLIFCDGATPSQRRERKWNAYDELRDQLTAAGVPREQIRFIHDARTDAEKGRLFAAARAGHIAVLIGSTQKMGVGTNVQTRCIALHHVDCPWRPADIEQREGRILRQGNQNEEVMIYRYVTVGSFDAFCWQTVERKARFINALMRGRLDVREIEDIGDSALSFAEVKALACGDELVLKKAQADAERTRLERLKRADDHNRQQIAWTIERCTHAIAFRETWIDELNAALSRRVTTRGEAFAMTIAGQRYTKRTNAAHALATWLITAYNGQRSAAGTTVPLGRLGALGGQGITATLTARDDGAHFVLRLAEVAASEAIRIEVGEIEQRVDGVLRSLENRVDQLPEVLDGVVSERDRAEDQLRRAREVRGAPFKHADALAAAIERSKEIDETIAERDSEQPPAPAAESTPDQGSGAPTGRPLLRAVGADADPADAASVRLAKAA